MQVFAPVPRLSIPQTPKRLVLPKPMLDRIARSMRRDMRPFLGRGELRVLDTQEMTHAVFIWNLRSLPASFPADAFGGHVEYLKGTFPAVPAGCALFREEADHISIHVHELELNRIGNLRKARVYLNEGKCPFIEHVRRFYQEPGWQPHGVRGGRLMQSDGTHLRFIPPLFLASSQHMEYQDVAFSSSGTSTLLYFVLDYTLPSIPNSYLLSAAIESATDTGNISIFLIGHPQNSHVELVAWRLNGLYLDATLLGEFDAQFDRSVQQFAGVHPPYTLKPELLEMRNQQWIDFFRQHVENKLVFRVPIENGRGGALTRFPV